MRQFGIVLWKNVNSHIYTLHKRFFHFIYQHFYCVSFFCLFEKKEKKKTNETTIKFRISWIFSFCSTQLNVSQFSCFETYFSSLANVMDPFELMMFLFFDTHSHSHTQIHLFHWFYLFSLLLLVGLFFLAPLFNSIFYWIFAQYVCCVYLFIYMEFIEKYFQMWRRENWKATKKKKLSEKSNKEIMVFHIGSL